MLAVFRVGAERIPSGSAVYPFTCRITVDSDASVDSVADAADAGLWINGGFFVFSHEIFEHQQPGEELVVEPFQRLIKAGELTAYRHEGFWAGMDTFKDRQELAELYDRGEAPWVVWNDG